ncbi:hypothetical protein OH77DRAFT_1135734 [Trametes cingulata]|nr:hypothetical protein OH77DRAFT_1135734 [Trametes cingulata]
MRPDPRCRTFQTASASVCVSLQPPSAASQCLRTRVAMRGRITSQHRLEAALAARSYRNAILPTRTVRSHRHQSPRRLPLAPVVQTSCPHAPLRGRRQSGRQTERRLPRVPPLKPATQPLATFAEAHATIMLKASQAIITAAQLPHGVYATSRLGSCSL